MADEEVLIKSFMKDDVVLFLHLVNTGNYTQELLQHIYNYSIKYKKWNFISVYRDMPQKFHYLLEFDQYNIEELIILNKLTKFKHSYHIFEYLLEIETPAVYLRMFMSYHDNYFIYKMLRIVDLSLKDLVHMLDELPHDMYKYQMELFTILEDKLLTIKQSDYLPGYIKRLIDFYSLDTVSRFVQSVIEGNNISPDLLRVLDTCGIRIYNINNIFSNLQLK